MEPFFADPDVERKPPQNTRIRSLQASLLPDRKRIRVAIEVTPFQKRPNIELVLVNSAGDEVTSASIIEPMAWKLELTLHIREDSAAAKNAERERGRGGSCTLTASLIYPDLGEIDRGNISVACPPIS